MFRHVIVGVDGRPAARDAIALARLLVAPDGRLSLAHVRATDLRHAHRSTRLGRTAAEDSQRLLARERAASDVEAELVSVAAPSVGCGLHRIADTEAADLLVVGSCGRGLAGRVLLGNDTQSALDGAPCAVAIAPLGYAHDLRAIAMIGVGYDGSPESEAALAAAHQLAGERAATLRALRVVKMPTSAFAGFTAAAWGQELEDILRATRERIAGLDGVEITAVLGLSGEELAAFGDKVDLLVVGSRGYGQLHRMMFGSTAAHLAAHGRCPLLVWPRTASGAEPADATSEEEPAAVPRP